MSIAFSCFCPGKPEAQGGTVPFKNKYTGKTMQVTKGSKGLPAWRKAMTKVFTLTAKTQGIHEPLQGALRTEMVFIIPRLASHPKQSDGELWPITYRDADKLERAVNDSLTKAGVICDDNRICVTLRVKKYGALTEVPGVHVTVRQITGEMPEMTNHPSHPAKCPQTASNAVLGAILKHPTTTTGGVVAEIGEKG